VRNPARYCERGDPIGAIHESVSIMCDRWNPTASWQGSVESVTTSSAVCVGTCEVRCMGQVRELRRSFRPPTGLMQDFIHPASVSHDECDCEASAQAQVREIRPLVAARVTVKGQYEVGNIMDSGGYVQE
jgi:hypothetical protein